MRIPDPPPITKDNIVWFQIEDYQNDPSVVSQPAPAPAPS
jgi:hypothetical protein